MILNLIFFKLCLNFLDVLLNFGPLGVTLTLRNLELCFSCIIVAKFSHFIQVLEVTVRRVAETDV